MRFSHRPAAVLIPLMLAACVAPNAPAPPPPVAAPAPPPPPAPPRTTDWRDIPLTPGDWRYDAATLTARFGPADAPVFTARCDAAARTVTLARITPAAAAPATMAITTSAGDRAFPATPVATPAPALAAAVPARDGFLDRMAFSRGRFVVAVVGVPRLVIPAWPEFARMVEECRG